MTNPSAFSKKQLIELLETQQNELQIQATELQKKESVIAQLQEKSAAWEAAYHKVWHERFSSRSERYTANQYISSSYCRHILLSTKAFSYQSHTTFFSKTGMVDMRFPVSLAGFWAEDKNQEITR